MYEWFVQLLSYPFMIRAIVVGLFVSLCASLLGVSLVLKRYSMIGDGLSHVSFGALSIALAMNVAPLKLSIPIVIAAAFFLLRISESSKMQGDAAIAMISGSSLAIGIIVTSITTGLNADVSGYMFGSILSMTKEDMWLSIILSIFVLTLFLIFYHKIFAITFDEKFVHANGMNTNFYQILIAILTAVTIVLGMRMMGAMLISSLIIFPPLTSMRLFQSFYHVIISSAITGCICFIIGILFSYSYSIPVGAAIVVANLTVFLLVSLVSKLLHT